MLAGAYARRIIDLLARAAKEESTRNSGVNSRGPDVGESNDCRGELFTNLGNSFYHYSYYRYCYNIYRSKIVEIC